MGACFDIPKKKKKKKNPKNKNNVKAATRADSG
jgi:hypothetical protein